MPYKKRSTALSLLVLGALAAASSPLCRAASSAVGGPPADGPADTVYRGGIIYTVDAHDSVAQALAVRAGRIVYVGAAAGLGAWVGPSTQQVDLHGHLLMPGLVDGHMHPLAGGASLLKCNLNYARLGVAELKAKIQACLDETRAQEPDGWLEVVNWFQEAMVPAGVKTSRATLDALKTKRPIFVISSFGHTALVNSRAIELAGISAATKDPLGGRIARDAAGNPSGILEDFAKDLVSRLLPAPTPSDDVRSARAALDAMRKQGITTFLDAAADPHTIAAFTSAEHEGQLTARAHFAVLVTPAEGPDAQKATAKVTEIARRYDQGPIRAEPKVTVRNFKLFLDGVITAPALTGAMLEPYWTPQGAGPARHFAAGTNRGPDVYFPAPVLRTLLVALSGAGFDPHMHADGDRAVHEALDGIEAIRAKYPGKDIRPAIAHDEIVDPQDFPRYRQLDAIPVLSFQWEKPAPDTVDGARDYMGPARYRYMEPAGFLAAAGARIAYGSDWPVDTLDEWFALKVGVTRTNSPSAGPKYSGRLSADSGLTREQALRAITLNSSYELHQDELTGSSRWASSRTSSCSTATSSRSPPRRSRR